MKKLIAGVIVIAVCFFLLERILGQGTEQRNYIYFDEMYQSMAYKAQSVNPHFPDGKTHQRSIEGTIPQGYMPLHYGISEDEMNRAGDDLISPFAAADTSADMARGQVVYQVYCQPCHGAGGQGDGTVSKRGYPPPTSLSSPQALGRKDGQMFHVITYGYKNMPAYATQVDREDRWHVIAYLRQLQQTSLQAQEAQNDPTNP